MKFVRLSHEVLWELKAKGYNILTSVNKLGAEDPTYMPEKVDSVWDYLDELAVVPMREPELIIIDDTLQNIRDENLRGMVWVEE